MANSSIAGIDSGQLSRGEMRTLLSSIRKKTAEFPFPILLTKEQVETGLMWSLASRANRRKGLQEPVTDVALAKFFGVSKQALSQRRGTFQENASWVKRLFKVLSEDFRFYDEKYRRLGLSETLSKARENRRKMVEDGWWVSSPVPLGYALPKGSRTLEFDPDMAPIIRRFFELVAAGELPLKAAKEAGLNEPTLHYNEIRILRNPVYKGYQLFEGQPHPANHKPLVDEKTWNRVQEWLEARRKHQGPSLGLLWDHGQLIVDSGEKARLLRICQLFVQGENTLGIAKDPIVRMDSHRVRDILRNTDYKLLGTEWVDANQRVKDGWLGRGGGARKVAKSQVKVLAGLVGLGGTGGTYKIAKEVRMSSRVQFALKRLREKGWLNREPGYKGAWSVVDMEATKQLIASRPVEVPSLKAFLKN